MKKTIVFSASALLLFAVPSEALQLLYTAEGDGAEATDRLTGDGAQSGAFTHTWSNNTKSATSDVFVTPLAANSKFGTSAFFFNKTATCLNTIDMQGASGLGSAFTLAAYVRPLAAPGLIRLFSTYNGEVRLYLDGTQVAVGTNGTGAVTMAQDLQVGEDVGAFGADEQLRGDADDVVVLFEALSPAEIAALKTVGAREFFGLPPLWPKGTLIGIQ